MGRRWPPQNEELWWARVRAGLTQAQLAAEVASCRQTISDLERCARMPSVGLALALAYRLDRSVEELFGPTGLR